MNLSSKFSIPLLIYDDKCSSCTKFAKTANILSRGLIRIAGHYYSQEAIEAKKLVFPPDYDPTIMFWLINKKGAFGARAGLIQVIKEIITGIFKGKGIKNEEFDNINSNNNIVACEYSDQLVGCSSPENTLKRIIHMVKNSKKFEFPN